MLVSEISLFHWLFPKGNLLFCFIDLGRWFTRHKRRSRSSVDSLKCHHKSKHPCWSEIHFPQTKRTMTVRISIEPSCYCPGELAWLLIFDVQDLITRTHIQQNSSFANNLIVDAANYLQSVVMIRRLKQAVTFKVFVHASHCRWKCCCGPNLSRNG